MKFVNIEKLKEIAEVEFDEIVCLWPKSKKFAKREGNLQDEEGHFRAKLKPPVCK